MLSRLDSGSDPAGLSTFGPPLGSLPPGLLLFLFGVPLLIKLPKVLDASATGEHTRLHFTRSEWSVELSLYRLIGDLGLDMKGTPPFRSLTTAWFRLKPLPGEIPLPVAGQNVELVGEILNNNTLGTARPVYFEAQKPEAVAVEVHV
jgi:hypothetical protein